MPSRNSSASPQVITSGGSSTITLATREPALATASSAQQSRDGHNSSFIPSFGVVYANDLAKSEIKKTQPTFPVGSIIVREKNLSATAENPETVIAMVKREKGFNIKTGDWEFFVLDGINLKLRIRQTNGSCADCHIRAKDTDWVFRDHLKKSIGFN